MKKIRISIVWANRHLYLFPGRRHRKKVLQALIPMFFGMKSAAIVIFAMTVVTVLTLKAFVASKMALIVTVGMALKRLYENYGTG